MEKLDFYIDNEKVKVLVDNNQRFIRGKSEILSTEQSDICYGLPWYKNGYQVFNFLSNSELIKIRKRVKAVIKRKISDTLKLEIENFKLDNYHRYVKKNKSHNLIVSKR